MKILVCISRVPDTTASIIPNEDKHSIDENGIKYIINPYDEYAIEEALLIAAKFDASITALTVGGGQNQDVMRTALALGVHNAVIVKSELKNDSYAIAYNIAEYAKKMNPDLIILGRQSVDFDSMQIPASISAMLDIPLVSVVSKIDFVDNKLMLQRDIENGIEVIQTKLPCIISTQKGLNIPRYPKLPNILKAKKKIIEIIEFKLTENKTEILDFEILNQSRNGTMFPNTDKGIEELIRVIKN